jgi:citrate lyase alpha subunit
MIDRSQGDSTMMVIAQNVQDMIDNSLRFQAEFMGQQEAAGSCTVNRDFIGARLDPADVNALLQLYTAGTITKDTLLQQLADGEVLGDDFDVQEEIDATANGGLQ